MTCSLDRVSRLRGDKQGAAAIETALVAPLLVLMSIGGFEISEMVARQHELQGGAAEATAVALAANQGATTDVIKLKAMLQDSLELSSNEVTVTKMYRCDARNSYTLNKSDCEGGGEDKKRYSTYVKIQLTDTYTPIWSKIGVSKPLTYHVNRWIQLS